MEEKQRVYMREYRKKNKDRIKERAAKYAKEHRAQYAEKARIRKERERQLENTLTCRELSQLWRYYNGRCAYCGENKPLEPDHLIPVIRGGGRTMANIVLACDSCNSSKGTKAFEEWYPASTVYSVEREQRILNRPQELQESVFYDIRIRRSC
jgi:5-methylcytosine-specific restriction endonuclease McrA